MRRDLPHLASLLFNRPLLVRSDVGRQVIDAIGPRILTGEALSRADIAAEIERTPREARSGSNRRLAGGAYMERDGIAVLPIVGSLVRRGSWLDAECGMMSYGLITSAVAEILMDSSVRGLMLEMDSGGGEANGCFDCADFIKSASAAAGKPVWAHANEIMCSAAYAIGSSGAKVWAARTSEIGSIGVLAAHVEVSERDKQDGVQWTYIFAGEHKTDGNMHEPLAEGPRARIQADVDHLYEMFLELTSQNRGMTTEELRATNADIYRGSLALEAGLADELGTLDEALEAFAEHVDESQTPGGSRLSASQMRVELMAPKTGKTTATAPGKNKAEEENTTTVVDLTDENGGDDAGTDTTGSEGNGGGDAGGNDGAENTASASAPGVIANAETERCAGLVALASQASRLGVSFDAATAIRKGMSVDAARKKIMDAAASAEGEEVSPIAKPVGRGGANAGVSQDRKASMWKKAIKRR